MDEETALRLETLKIAAQGYPGANAQTLMSLAAEFLAWVKSGKTKEALSQPELPFKGALTANPSRPATIKDMILAILDEAGTRGLTAQQILEEIKLRWWPSLERTSLSPQLSRLKSDDQIAYVGGIYRIPTTLDKVRQLAERTRKFPNYLEEGNSPES